MRISDWSSDVCSSDLLDVTTQAQILALIKDIQRRHGMAVLFITHDFGLVSEIADRVVVMRSGRVVAQWPAAGLLTDPKDPYTQMLMAALPCLTPPARAVPRPAPPAPEVCGMNRVYGGGGRGGRVRKGAG